MLDQVTTAGHARRVIAGIDKNINAVSRDLFASRRPHWTAEHCQAARDARPHLAARFDAMYRARGQMQAIRDAADYAENLRRLRSTRPRAKKCPACKGTGRAA